MILLKGDLNKLVEHFVLSIHYSVSRTVTKGLAHENLCTWNTLNVNFWAIANLNNTSKQNVIGLMKIEQD